MTKRWEVGSDGKEYGCRWTYDEHGNTTRVESLTYAKSWNEYTFNEAGDILTYLDGSGQSSVYTRDAYGNMLTFHQENPDYDFGYIYTYDEQGNVLTRQETGTETVVVYTYDENGNRLTESNGGNILRSWEYDAQNRIVKEVNYGFSAEGPVKSREVNCQYDDAGRLIREDEHYNFDPETGDYQSSTTVCTYNEHGDVLTKTIERSDGYQNTTTFSYVYDANGCITELTETSTTDGQEPLTKTTYYTYTSIPTDQLPIRWQGTLEIMGKG